MKKVIKTKRLILSPLEQEDSPSFIKIAQNMRQKKTENRDYFLYSRFDDDAVKNEEDLIEAVDKLLQSANDIKPEETVLRLKIALKKNDVIGYVGYLYTPENDPPSDFGIFLDPHHEHKGYAFEAEKALLAHFFTNCDNKIYLTIHPENISSLHLNQKCGAVKTGYEKESKYGSERDVFVITREAFIKTVWNKEFSSDKEEEKFLIEYLNQHD